MSYFCSLFSYLVVRRSLRHCLWLLVGTAHLMTPTYENKQHPNICKNGCAYRAYKMKMITASSAEKVGISVSLGVGSAGSVDSSWKELFPLRWVTTWGLTRFYPLGGTRAPRAVLEKNAQRCMDGAKYHIGVTFFQFLLRN